MASARIAVSTFGCCSSRLTMKPAGAPSRESFDALGERVEQLGSLQVHVHDRVRHDLIAVAATELGREMQRRRQVGSERRKLERRRFDTGDPNRDVGAVGQRVDRRAVRGRVTGEALPEVAEELERGGLETRRLARS